MKKNRKWLLLVLAAVLVIALAAWKWLALRPQQPSPERRGKILDELSGHWSWMVRAAVAENSNTTAETLKRLADDSDQSVQKAARGRMG